MVNMRINTGNHAPIKMRPYMTPIHKRRLVEEAVRNMLESGMIEISESPWNFLIAVVNKKDGGKRFCIDFRKLNAISKPLPTPAIDKRYTGPVGEG